MVHIAKLILPIVIGLTLTVGCTSSDGNGDSASDTDRKPNTDAAPHVRTEPDGPPPEVEPGLELSAEECQAFKTTFEAGPSQPLIPGAIDDGIKQQTMQELQAAVDAAPEVARDAMATYAQAYQHVLDELANLQGIQDPTRGPDPEQMRRINDIMTTPQVTEARTQIEAWLNAC
jgi:hypothetical protein